ncbi:MAG: hypothetical protein JWO58_394 [Chitinophagaceae bacterium]|nr:hypothetical protein [Chitinophagaceae bacterium]
MITKKNIHTMGNRFILLFFVLVIGRAAFAQDSDKVKFGAYGRALQQNTRLGNNDTLNADNVSRGHVLVDLGININPDKRTEVQAIIRMRSDIGSFYAGPGSTLLLRQLYIKGLIGKYVSYQVGDLYLQMSPYTFFNNNAEGTINEGRIFSDFRRDYTNYENLSNRGNSWWQQGAATNFSLAFKESKIDSMRVDAFFVRNRPENYIATSPAALFHAGGRVTLTSTEKMKLIGNYVNLFEVGKTANIDSVISNPVMSLQLDYTLWNNSQTMFRFVGEGGYSQMIFKGYENRATKDGSFIDAAVKLHVKPANLLFGAGYSYVDPQFFSSAAQTKRVNFANTPSAFPIYGNDPLNPVHRTATIFDLVKDTAVYNQAIRSQLMSYDPTLNNSQAYGKATPNRQGVNVDIQYKDSAQKIMANVNAAYLTEISGEGSAQKRNFLVLKGGADFHIHKFIGWKKKLIVTTGARFEQTKRGGDSLEKVDLKSLLIDLGLEIEILNKLDVIAGWKILNAKGNEFIAIRNKYNDIINFNNANTANININQSMLAFGLKYRFSSNTYITVQDHIFTYTDSHNSLRNFSMNQFLIMFNMNF